MPTPTDGPIDRLAVLAFIRLTEPTDQEDGYLPQGMKDPSTSLCQENWESVAQLDARLDTSHLVRFAGMIRDLLNENGLTMPRLQWIA